VSVQVESTPVIPSRRSPAPAVRRPRVPSAGGPLRIGVVAPPWFELPPVGYGGTEAVVAALVDQLVERGHDVTLVASGRPGTKATHNHVAFAAPPSDLLGSSALPEVIQAVEAAHAFDGLDLDIVHDNSLAGPLLAYGRSIPTVVTMHGPVNNMNGDYYRRMGEAVDLVAISDAQRRLAPAMHWVGTVHNAVDVSSFPYRADKEDWVLWLGRFCAEKGAHLAIDAARAAGRKILLAGKRNEVAEREYFDAQISPRLGSGVEYVGEADAAMKRELFSRAACLVFPIRWEEPFGMVMAEALACGTPVVALRRGSVPEIIDDGVTGYVTDDPADLPGLINRVRDLDPAACRAAARAKFDLPVMAAGYERVYRRLIARSQAGAKVGTAA